MIREEFVVSGVKYQLFSMRIMKDICTLISCSVTSYSASSVQVFDRYKVNWEMYLADCAELCGGLDIDLESCQYILSPHSITAESLTHTLGGVSINIKISAFEKNLLCGKSVKEIGRLHLIYEQLRVLSRKSHELARVMADSLRRIVLDNTIKLFCSFPHSVLEDFVAYADAYSSQCLDMDSDKTPRTDLPIGMLLNQLYYLRGSLDTKYEKKSIETLDSFATKLADDNEFRDYNAFVMKLCSRSVSCSLKANCMPLYIDMMYRFCCFRLEYLQL